MYTTDITCCACVLMLTTQCRRKNVINIIYAHIFQNISNIKNILYEITQKPVAK